MTHRITSHCVNCGVCKAICDYQAIRKGTYAHEVLAEECVDCGQCALICPTAACRPDHSLYLSPAGAD